MLVLQCGRGIQIRIGNTQFDDRLRSPFGSSFLCFANTIDKDAHNDNRTECSQPQRTKKENPTIIYSTIRTFTVGIIRGASRRRSIDPTPATLIWCKKRKKLDNWLLTGPTESCCYFETYHKVESWNPFCARTMKAVVNDHTIGSPCNHISAFFLTSSLVHLNDTVNRK